MTEAPNALQNNELVGGQDPAAALARAAVRCRHVQEFWAAATGIVSDWAGGAYVRISYTGRRTAGTVEGGPRFRTAAPVEHEWRDAQSRRAHVTVVTEEGLPTAPPLHDVVDLAAHLAVLVGRRATLERERRLTSFLVELSRWMATSVSDPQRFLRYTLQSVMRLIGADGAVTLIRPAGTTGLDVRAAVGTATRLADAMDTGVADACVRIVESGQPALVNDLAADSDLARSAALRAWLRAAMIVPLKTSTGCIGALAVFRSLHQSEPPPFELDDLSYLDAVAAHIASGIELAEAIRAAQQAARRARTMVDGSPFPLALIGWGGDVVQANGAFVALVGAESREALVGQPCAALPLRPATGELQDALQSARESQPWEGRIVVERAGSRRTCDGIVTPLGDGATGEVLLALADRTDQLRAQRELIAREKLATIGELASGVAHEVNNPLAAIRMEAELLGEADDRQETRAAVDVILKEVDRAARIARSLLHLTRRSGAAPAYVQVNDLLRDVVEIRGRVARSEGTTIQADLDPNLPSLHVPAADLQQVFINLVTNAEHAVAEHENAVIEIRTRAMGDLVQIRVADSGRGVDPVLRTRIFDPFFTTKGPDEGSGLGLALSQSIVTDLGGRIWVEESESLGGAEFVVELPVAHDEG